MIRLKNVSKWYSNRVRVLDQINLELKKGEFLYVVGGTGAGKSSLLRLLATEELPCEGSLSLFGYDVATAGATTIAAIRRCVGYVPQNVRLIPDLTVYDNIALSLSLSGHRVLNADARAKIHELLERVGLGNKRDVLAGHISGGEAQKVAVARALVRSPELVVADEPTGAQDHDSAWTLMDLFVRANVSGATIVVATHDREIVRRVRKRCATIKGGRLGLEDMLCIY